MLFLDGYFDESGTHEESPAVAFAGYVSTKEQWELFAEEWSDALDLWGVGSFHMTDFANRAGPYREWTEVQCRDRFAHLTDIIARHAIATVGSVLSGPLYQTLVEPDVRRYTGYAYGVVASSCLMAVPQVLEAQYPSARVAYTFDQGCKGRGQVHKLFEIHRRNPVERAQYKLRDGPLAFASAKEALPLQAADILAYELYRHLPHYTGKVIGHPAPATCICFIRFGRDPGTS